MALRSDGKYWFGDGPADVWDHFVRESVGTSVEVNRHRQAVCPCGGTVFLVDYDEDTQFLRRTCVACDAEVVMFADEFADIDKKSREPEPEPEADPLECICAGEEFEVVGVTAPGGNPESAWYFYLGLRCVGCGCLGSYVSWIPRYNDGEAFLDML